MNYQSYELAARNIRRNIVKMVAQAGSGHPGGSLSAVELLTALYFHEMNVDATNPKDVKRDRFVLSKGHASPLLYSTLAEKGFFPKDELMSFRQINSNLQGHPSMTYVKGVDMSTGSLGQGISAAVGMALSAKYHNEDYRTYALLGDGELQEGQVWEAAMAAGHYKLDNLMAIVDYNGLQIDGDISTVMNPNPIADKFVAFGWNVISIDGHSYDEIFAAYDEARNTKGKPTLIVAKTIKGKGVSYMENNAGWHGNAPNQEQLEIAMNDLGGSENE